jgi:hemerythrin
MQWKDEYSLGIQEIDEQHKRLLTYFSRIEDAVNANKGWSDIHFAIVDLRAFSMIHFEFEEALMRLYGFGNYPDHIKGHLHYMKKLEDIERASLGSNAAGELVVLLREWLKVHILGEDRKYADYILSGASIVRPTSGDT